MSIPMQQAQAYLPMPLRVWKSYRWRRLGSCADEEAVGLITRSMVNPNAVQATCQPGLARTPATRFAPVPCYTHGDFTVNRTTIPHNLT